MGLLAIALVNVLLLAGSYKVDPLLLLELDAQGEAQPVIRCQDEPVSSVRAIRDSGTRVPNSSVVSTATEVVKFLRWPPCETSVTKLEHWLESDVEVFHVKTSRSCWSMQRALVVHNGRGSIYRLDPELENFGREYQRLFWDPDGVGEDSIQPYAAFFIKLLNAHSGPAFLPSREVADYVIRQPLGSLRDRPESSLKSLRWPFPAMRVLGTEAEAETYLWHHGAGQVTEFHLRIERDGHLQWSEDLVGEQEYE